MLDLRRMMLLCDLAELGTVTAVAERRGITSSAVSQQLRVLEEEADAVLFRRAGRTLGLTRSGEVLVEHAQHVLGAIDEAMSAVAATRDTLSGQVAVSSFNMGIPMLVTPMMQRVSQAQPSLHLQVRQADTPESLRLLRQGELDVAITCRYYFSAQESLSGLASERLLHEPLVLLAPRSLHIRIRTDGLPALADEPWATGPVDSGLGQALVHACAAAGFVPHIKHRVVGAQNICDLAATEVAVALVPRLSVPPQLAGLVVDGLDLGWRVVNVVVREGRRRDPAIVMILRFLRLVVAGDSPSPPEGRLDIAS